MAVLLHEARRCRCIFTSWVGVKITWSGGGGVNEFSIYFKDTACFSRCAYFLRSRNGHGHERVNFSLMNRGRVIRDF